MRTHTTIARTIATLAAFTAGCADAPTITSPAARIDASGPSASVFYEHEVIGLSSTTYTSFAQPTADYIQNTTKIDISSLTEGVKYSSITDGTQTVGFPFNLMERQTVPTSYAAWSSPPQSESGTPPVLRADPVVLTALTFSTPVAAVGFELEPGAGSGPQEVLVEFYDDVYTFLGAVHRSVEGNGGARLFSFSTDWSKKISRVDISVVFGNLGAIAQVRYSLTPLPNAPPAGTTATIDIKPNTAPNDVQRSSKGLLPVAVLTTPTFDAATVDVASVTLGNETGTDTRVAKQNKKTPMAAMQDVDLDGDRDLILQFEIPALVANGDLTASTTQLVLKGTRTGGGAVRGVDNVVVKP
jgi:hypothetical protein